MNLTPAELERFLERASIMEYEGALPRAQAEAMAMESVMAERQARLEREVVAH